MRVAALSQIVVFLHYCLVNTSKQQFVLSGVLIELQYVVRFHAWCRLRVVALGQIFEFLPRFSQLL